MTAPTLEPLSEEELGRIEARGRVCVTCGKPRKGHNFRHRFETDIDLLIAEVRAHRAAALSEADRETLGGIRSVIADSPAGWWRPTALALLDRLLGRSAGDADAPR